MAPHIEYDLEPESESQSALHEWLQKQAVQSADNLEAAARQLITLVTALLSVLLGLFTLTGQDLPAYMEQPWVRGLGAAGVVMLLLCLSFALRVVLPGPWSYNPNKPDEELETFRKIMRHKANWLNWALTAFWLASLLLAGLLIAAIILI